jgi:hypothetical protein
MEKTTTTTPLRQQQFLQPQKQWHQLDNRSHYTDLEGTLQCLEASEPWQTWQRRRAPMPNQARPSQEANTGPISSSTSLQPHQSPKMVLRQPRRTFSSWTLVDTASKLGNNIWTNDPSPSPDPTPTQPARPHGDRRGFWTHHLSHTNTDVRTFVSHWVLSWHWKPHGAPSFSSVSRTSPFRGPGWWPLGMAGLAMSFLSR